jgi:hypothetical protein
VFLVDNLGGRALGYRAGVEHGSKRHIEALAHALKLALGLLKHGIGGRRKAPE